jgi:hypothetical protein
MSKSVVINDEPEMRQPEVPCERCGEALAKPLGGQLARWFTFKQWVDEFPRMLRDGRIPIALVPPEYIPFETADSKWFIPSGRSPYPIPTEPYRYRTSRIEVEKSTWN